MRSLLSVILVVCFGGGGGGEGGVGSGWGVGIYSHEGTPTVSYR